MTTATLKPPRSESGAVAPPSHVHFDTERAVRCCTHPFSARICSPSAAARWRIAWSPTATRIASAAQRGAPLAWPDTSPAPSLVRTPRPAQAPRPHPAALRRAPQPAALPGRGGLPCTRATRTLAHRAGIPAMSTPPRDNSPPPRSARQDGIAALRAGDAAAARRLLAEAVIGAPDNLEAWLWLSGAVSTDGERRYCLLRVQALGPAHPTASRGLAMLPPVDPVDPLLSAFPGASAAPTPPEPPATPAAPLVVAPVAVDMRPPPPLPPSEEAPSERAPRLLWGAVGALSAILIALLGLVAVRVVAGGAPQQAAAVAALASSVRPLTPAPTVAPALPSPTTITPSSTPPPAATATSEPSPTPAPPTPEPTALPTAAAPGDDSAAALAARGLLRERRDDDDEGALADYISQPRPEHRRHKDRAMVAGLGYGDKG